MKTRLGVIFGGRSGEHEISIRSAITVIEQIDKEKYEVIPIAITREGSWLNPGKALNLLPPETRALLSDKIGNSLEDEIAILGDTSFKGLTKLGRNNGEKFLPLDVVFPVLHGTYGEDGTIQGLFEMAGIPYVGCGVLAADLPICRYVWFLRSEWERNNDLVIKQTSAKLGFPCFVKPANLGSSVGVSKADDEESLRHAIALAAEYDRKIIVEEGLDAREIECAVIGNDEPQASLPGEYIVHADDKKFLDYTEKYAGTGNNEFIVPALISQELTKKIQEMAVTAFKAVDGAGFARVDFFLRNDNGMLLVNEINTIPGLTNASGFPKMWAGSGKNFAEVIDLLVTFAIERYNDKSKNKTNL